MLCVRAANGERKHKGVGWVLLGVWLISIFGIVGFGIQMNKEKNLQERLERTGAAIEWMDGSDYSTHDEYYNTKDIDGIIEPVLDNLRDGESTYDISIQSSPKNGVNLRIQSNDNPEKPVTSSDSM